MKTKITVLTALIALTLSLRAQARPAAFLFDSQPATVADAQVADSPCTQYGIITNAMGVDSVKSYPNIYACAMQGMVTVTIEGITNARHINQLYIEDSQGPLVGKYSKTILPNGVRIEFIPPQPIVSGTELLISPQSDILVEHNGQWRRFPRDIDYYVEAL
ncbi:hypothetical protein K1X76_04655 [bacterium]|nr:hypothetical protein [bacterium]